LGDLPQPCPSPASTSTGTECSKAQGIPRVFPPFQIFRFSVWEGRPLPGMALMNLRYRNEAAVQLPRTGPRAGSSSSSGGGTAGSSLGKRAIAARGRSGVEGPGLNATQRTLYCLGAVVLRYAWARLAHAATSDRWGDAEGGGVSWRQRGWAAMRRVETAYRLASLLNFLAFLRTGRYR
jgi:peroxin-2